MRINAILNNTQKVKAVVPFCGVVKNLFSEKKCSTAQEYYYKNMVDSYIDPWDMPCSAKTRYDHLTSEAMGVSVEQARKTYPRITLSALNCFYEQLENMSQYKSLVDENSTITQDEKIESVRNYAQNKLLNYALYDIKRAQKTINRLIKTFSGHRMDINKAKMLDGALEAKRAHKKHSKPIKIEGEYYISALSTKKEEISSSLNQKNIKKQVDYLTLTRLSDGLEMKFRQRDTKDDFDFMADSENYGQQTRLTFDLVEVKTPKDIIFCNPSTQVVESMYKNAFVDKNNNGICERRYALKHKNEASKHKRGFFISEKCTIKNGEIEKSNSEFRYNTKNGLLFDINALDKKFKRYNCKWNKIN